ncbi:DoxX family protein [Cyanobacterium stanieri LEGE 03274]|uniref:DoxX family protein n=1 Tax=Cyanobacterium stanieri LEGE 03274 TaxID=1828756 RepID=A0ABR9V6D1_9CHRO|nr:DoxX family protein [Cyanobacterium stanieri]MBE9223442.1 DoxX family protein [Cyanobacterium stanieri LEGE 03274]
MKLSSIISTTLEPRCQIRWTEQTAWTLLRVVIGVMMIHNGLDKLGNIESFAEAYVSYIGLPFPIFFSYVAAYTELIGAPLVAIGLLTRPAALGLFGTMCVAMYHHILVAGLSLPYLELSAIYAGCFFFFLVNGGGLFSVDAVLSNLINKNLFNQKIEQTKLLEKVYQDSNSEEQKSLS